MRIDRFMSDAGLLSRRECAAAVSRGLITADGVPVTAPSVHIDPERQTIAYRGTPVIYRAFTYIMLNKPEGYVSATEDRSLPYVVELLSPELQRVGLFPAGRLDRDTTGLLVLTNDGALAHAWLSPRRHVEKLYRFTCREPLCPEAEARCAAGITIGDYVCKPAVLCPDPDRLGGTVTLTEGKYHQIKRMLGALGNAVTSLERLAFGTLRLDPSLPRGGYRFLTEAEITALRSCV